MSVIRVVLVSAIVLIVASAGVTAQSFTGSFHAPSDNGVGTSLTLFQSGDRLTGSMRGPGDTAKIDGFREGKAMVGTLTMGQAGWLRFAAEIDGSVLILTVFSETPEGEPDFESATTFLFERIVTDPLDSLGKTSGRDVVIGKEPDR